MNLELETLKIKFDALKAENEEIMETLEEVHKANKILEPENERLIAMCENLAGALRFYAERKHLEYLRLHGEEYVKEIGGKRAREALTEYEKLKGEK